MSDPSKPGGAARNLGEAFATNPWPLGPRGGWAAVAIVLGAYGVAFCLFYPETVTVRDEASYVRQARLMLEGTTTLTKIHPLTGAPFTAETLSYPVGTALLMAPLIAALDWQACFAMPVLALLVGTLVTADWLRRLGHSPFFALVIPGFPASLIMARIAMSDVPSLAWVSVALWLFWVGLLRPGQPRVAAWLGCGLLAGSSLLLREANALLFAPLFAGCMLRRESGCWTLALGTLVGVSLRLVSSALAYGDPFYFKSVSGAGFALGNVVDNAGIYALALLVAVPGGLLATASYRGTRRPEIVATVVLFTAFHLTYGYSAEESGFAKRLVLAHRFFLPLLPFMALVLADVLPRLRGRLAEGSRRAPRLVDATALASVAIIGVAAVVVHPVHAEWSARQARIRKAIERHTAEESVVVTNWSATAKAIDLVRGRYFPIDRARIVPHELRLLASQYPDVRVVLLDRTDSAHWRKESSMNALFAKELRSGASLVADEAVSDVERLRVWKVEGRSRARPR